MSTMVRGMLGLACFVLIGSIMLLFMVTPGSAEFYVTVISAVIGVIAVVGATFMARWTLQRPSLKEEER